MAEPSAGGHQDYHPDACRVAGCDLTPRYHGYCIKHWRNGMTEEEKAPEVKLPAADQMTEDEQRDAIRKAPTNWQACVALGICKSNSAGLHAQCQRLGVEVPSERGKAADVPKQKTIPTLMGQLKADAAARRKEQAATYPLSAVAEPALEPMPPTTDSAPAESAGPAIRQRSPAETAQRRVAAMRAILGVLDDLADLAAAQRVVGAVAVLMGCNIHHEANLSQ
jgi:hypothetical protein